MDDVTKYIPTLLINKKIEPATASFLIPVLS